MVLKDLKLEKVHNKIHFTKHCDSNILETDFILYFMSHPLKLGFTEASAR